MVLVVELSDMDEWDVVMHPCLSVCDQPVAIAVQGAVLATYAFAGLTDAVLSENTCPSITRSWHCDLGHDRVTVDCPTCVIICI